MQERDSILLTIKLLRFSSFIQPQKREVSAVFLQFVSCNVYFSDARTRTDKFSLPFALRLSNRQA